MNRLLFLLCLPLLLVVISPTQTSSRSSDEETLKKLEIEGAKRTPGRATLILRSERRLIRNT